MAENENTDFDDFFGQAKSGGFDWKNHSITEEGPNVFRIAPPCKSLKAAGRWMVYDALHYAYTVPNDQAPDKPYFKPFRCIKTEDRQTKMITQDCPECTLMEQRKNAVDAQEMKFVSEGKTPDEAKEMVKGARKALRDHNIDKKFYVLAKNLKGEWGVLKIPTKAKQQMQKLMDDYTKATGGATALDPRGGLWFEFTRSGKGLNTEYMTKIATESTGPGTFQYKNGALAATDIEGINKCPDLASFNDSKVLTYDQILALVKSGGDQTLVKQVFEQPRRSQPGAQPSPPRTVPAPAAAAPVVMPPPTAETKPVVDQAATIAQLQAQLAAAQAAAAATAPVVPTPPTVSVPAVAPLAGAPGAGPFNAAELMKLDPAAFLAKFPDPNKK